MKKLIILLAALFIAIAAGAQNLQDVVYLLNGSVVRGTLIEQVPNVKIRTYDGSIWVFKQEEVDKITSEPVENAVQQQYDDVSTVNTNFEATKGSGSRRNSYYHNLTHGFRFSADVQVLSQTSYHTCSGVGYAGSFGYQVMPNLYLGGGLAPQVYIDYWYYNVNSSTSEPELYAQLPLFADVRYDAFVGRYSPFVDARFGYAVSLDEVNDYSGWYLNPSVGFRFRSFSVSVGLDLVKLEEPWYFVDTYANFSVKYTEIKWQSSVMFRFAYEWGGRL